MSMSMPPDLPVPSTSTVLRPRSRATFRVRSEGPSVAGSRPNSTGSSYSHGSSVSGTRTAPQPNSSAEPRMLPGLSNLIGPGRSAVNSSSHPMDGEDINQWWLEPYPYPVSPVAANDGFSYGNNESAPRNSIHYPQNSTTPYSFENSNYQNTSDPYGQSLGWEMPFGGFTMGSSESSLAGALGDGRRRQREDSTEPNFNPPPSYINGSSTSFSIGNNWVPPYAGPSHMGSHFDYREPSGSQSGPGSMDPRYFDEGLLPDRFPVHNADVQTTMSEVNPSPTTHTNDISAEPDRKGKGKARESIVQNSPSTPDIVKPDSPPKQPIPSTSEVPATPSKSSATKTTKPPADPLSEYTCPICFYAPTNATITPCGHVCCGACLFTAVKAGLQRAGMDHHPGNRGRTAPEARCPVCRSIIPGWDGKGGGVFGLKLRAIFQFLTM